MSLVPIPSFSLVNWISYKLAARRLKKELASVNKPLSSREKYDYVVAQASWKMHSNWRMVEVSEKFHSAGHFDKVRQMVTTHRMPE